MTIHRRADGRWRVRWKEAGNEREIIFPTEAEARVFDAKHKVNRGQAITVPSLALIAASYLNTRTLHRETRTNIRAYILGPAAPFAEKPADTLDRQDLEMLRLGMARRGASPSTINKAQTYIHAMLSWAVDQGLISHNPWAGMRRLKAARPPVVATIEDVQRIMAAS